MVRWWVLGHSGHEGPIISFLGSGVDGSWGEIFPAPIELAKVELSYV